MRVISVALPGMLAQARVLGRSLRRHEPDWEYEVAVLRADQTVAGLREEFSVVSLSDELDLDLDALVARHDPARAVGLLVPRLLEKRCAAASGPLLHLPATAWVLASLAPLAEAIRDRGIVLAPRLAGDLPADRLEPTREQLAVAGRVAPELIGVDGSPASISFLRWWIERADAVLEGIDEPRRAYDAEDWRWLLRTLELAPTRFATAVLEDPGCNVSVWNLHERALDETAAGVVVERMWPLRLVDLPGFEVDHPYRLNPASSRVRMSRMPALRVLAIRYVDELVDAGWHDLFSRVGVGGRLANGLVFDDTMSYLHASAAVLGESFGDLFTPDGTEAFVRWLRQPVAPWGEDGISRYVVQRIARERSDVMKSFPDMYGADSARFAAWWRRSGRQELDVPVELLATNGENGAAALVPVSAPRPRPRVVQAAPPGRDPGPIPAAPAGHLAADGAPFGVRVTGYLSHVLGLGSAARGYARALEAAGLPLSTTSVPLNQLEAPVELGPDYGRHSYQDVVHEAGHGFELVCVNADELPDVLERLGEDYFVGPRIGVWGWETNTIPPRWAAAFELVDEIWVYSQFMADNIGALAPVPVLALPPPVEAPSRNRSALRLGVPPGFLFLFVFDYLSTIQRKNPVGLVEAFKSAFQAGEGPQLLIKTINAPLRPDAEEEVLWAVQGRPDIHVIDRSLSADEKDALMFACDCYVSLHRSEGFGLTMAEAMSIGKAVIGTGYSGNVDFMNARNSYLVDYRITRVGPGCEIYPPEGEWADPDVEHAEALMRRVYERPDEAARVGAQARQDIARTLSPEATGGAMRRRLEQLAASGVAVRH